jgi:hypothetical protein
MECIEIVCFSIINERYKCMFEILLCVGGQQNKNWITKDYDF